MTWQEILQEPTLANLPYKIETNEYGQVILSPTVFLHGIYQARIAELLKQHLRGFTSLETPITTSKGTKVPDVTWFSEEFFLLHQDATDLPIAPPICVEIISRTNSPREIIGKRKLYFASGAEEVWTCDLIGQVRFYGEKGELKASVLAPEFPNKIELMTRQ